tara:strand:+ start:347 stop:937 length:591 start_codon:yes stop_codon:yes gene_type:complete
LDKKISLYIFFLPVLTVIISYFISAGFNYVPWCVPLIDGCTSISKVGRYGISFYLYKLFIIPTGLLIFFYFIRIHIFIYKNIFLLMMSFIICLALIVYLGSLGFEGSIYRFMREIGIFLFFIFMPLLQILITSLAPSEYFKTKLFIFLILILYSVFIFAYLIILKLDNSNYENIIEWNIALLIFLFFPIFEFSRKV